VLELYANMFRKYIQNKLKCKGVSHFTVIKLGRPIYTIDRNARG